MQLETDVADASRLVAVARAFPTNQGEMCKKGWTSADPLQSRDRLTAPLVRDSKGGALRAASWDEALDRVVSGIRAAQATGGIDAVGIFGGGGLTNEKAYALGKFARVGLRTRNIDYNGRFCMASGAVAGSRALGMDRGLPFPLEDIPGADTIMLVGSNPAETMPPIMRYFEAQRARGGRLIVVDPRRTATAEAATLFLQPAPGTDAAVANGLLHIAVRDKLIDEDFIAERTEGWEGVRRIVASWWPDRAERATGVPARLLVEAAHMLGEVDHTFIMTGRGPEQQSHGVDNVLAFINLALALGKAGKRHSGWGTFTGQGNGQGGREHGQKADQLPGYRSISNPEHRAAVAAVWGVEPASLPQPGLPATELLAACGGSVRALLVFGANLLVSAPAAGQVAARLRALDMLVVADPFLSETAAIADVVLPSTQWAEEEGTMTNLEGRVLLRRRMVPVADGVRTDLEIVHGLAERLGCGGGFPSEPRTVFEELRRASAGGLADYSGVTWERIAAEDGVFWPCPRRRAPGDAARVPRPVRDRERPGQVPPRRAPRDGRGDGRRLPPYSHDRPGAGAIPVRHADPARRLAECGGPGGVLRDPFRHRPDARGRARRHGPPHLPARHRRRAGPPGSHDPDGHGLRAVPLGGAGCANLLTSTFVDPVSKIPEFKVCAVHVAPAEPAVSAEAASAVTA